VPARLLQANKEHIMDKRSEVHAVYAESLVFESNFGRVEGLATDSGHAVTKRAQPMAAAGAVADENAGTRRTLRSLINDQVWPGF
jgi:hypothetical protein